MVSVLHFPGTNCHDDVYHFYKSQGYEVSYVWHTEDSLPKDTRLAVLAGGFSYGDYLRCGAIAVHSRIMKALRKYIDNGGITLGICNGFQILCEARILPGILMRNKNLKFVSTNAALEVVDNDNRMLSCYERGRKIHIPIAHGEGNYQILPKDLESLYENNQVLLKYVDEVNGSTDRIAGICNKDRNVYALMPHPERAVCEKIISPNLKSNTDGIEILKTLLKSV